VWKAPDPEPWFTPPDQKYTQTLSVVLPCGSEHDFFERTIQSVFAATPPELLKEIIVVDDNSDPPLEPLLTLNKAEYKVKFVRSDVPLGLIDAKHQGALQATGDILVFFDCHVKPALGYWEPFVREITNNPKRVVVPVITSLDIDSWTEFGRPSEGGMNKCYLTFDSEFKWTTDDTPWIPIMSGGLLAIGREWFFQVRSHGLYNVG
jgi:cellulose synthase/poly-beta-1,6-N-acetylglucosamine synthase-like glycosyltransferase